VQAKIFVDLHQLKLHLGRDLPVLDRASLRVIFLDINEDNGNEIVLKKEIV